ncbi:hypothetical protein AKO1_000631 [Acrasis kona]|uniref:OTU domain-containing protein n=1 Tax=Acrasis kona TaxID=1008807 RepID=A0AAW2ZQK3_9EUKA
MMKELLGEENYEDIAKFGSATQQDKKMGYIGDIASRIDPDVSAGKHSENRRRGRDEQDLDDTGREKKRMKMGGGEGGGGSEKIITIKNGQNYHILPKRKVLPKTFSKLQELIKREYEFFDPVLCTNSFVVIDDNSVIVNDDVILAFCSKKDLTAAEIYKELGLERFAVPGEGNCLFSCIEELVDDSNARMTITNHMSKQLDQYMGMTVSDAHEKDPDNKILIAMLGTYDEQKPHTVGQYLQEMSNQRIFGSAAEIIAAVEIYKVRIKIYRNGFQNSNYDYGDSDSIINLHYDSDTLHYDILRPKSQQRELGGGGQIEEQKTLQELQRQLDQKTIRELQQQLQQKNGKSQTQHTKVLNMLL